MGIKRLYISHASFRFTLRNAIITLAVISTIIMASSLIFIYDKVSLSYTTRIQEVCGCFMIWGIALFLVVFMAAFA